MPRHHPFTSLSSMILCASLLQDLGPQIGYRTVFVLEYLGPILIMLFYAMRPGFLYGDKAGSWSDYNWVAKLGVVAWVVHFAKREYETFFVHRFSRPTMPLSNLFKNCWYYWGFALVVGYSTCHPDFKAPDDALVWAGLAVFALSELGNLKCHLMLRDLRPAEGAKERPIPSGFLFDFVSCPNYTFEVASWVGFSIMTKTSWRAVQPGWLGVIVNLDSWIFTTVGFLQMLDWALQKHKNYYKTYGDEYKKLRRKAMVPLVI
jgi:very-long-chain enoyl-CoA reductase